MKHNVDSVKEMKITRKGGKEKEQKDDLIFVGDQSLYFCGLDIISRLHFKCSSIICTWVARTDFQITP